MVVVYTCIETARAVYLVCLSLSFRKLSCFVCFRRSCFDFRICEGALSLLQSSPPRRRIRKLGGGRTVLWSAPSPQGSCCCQRRIHAVAVSPPIGFARQCSHGAESRAPFAVISVQVCAAVRRPVRSVQTVEYPDNPSATRSLSSVQAADASCRRPFQVGAVCIVWSHRNDVHATCAQRGHRP